MSTTKYQDVLLLLDDFLQERMLVPQHKENMDNNTEYALEKIIF